jgi:hypothetical protein
VVWSNKGPSQEKREGDKMEKLYCPESTGERLEEWQWLDRIEDRQGDIELEWVYLPGTKSCVYLNRIFYTGEV